MKRKSRNDEFPAKRVCEVFSNRKHIRDDDCIRGSEVKQLLHEVVEECKRNMELALQHQAAHFHTSFQNYIARGMGECGYIS